LNNNKGGYYLVQISSFTNDKIKYLRSLYRKKYRREENKFVIEGVRIIEEALKEDIEIDSIFYSNYLFRNKRGEELLINLQKYDLELIEITDKLLTEVADTQSPQGIIAIVNKGNNNLEDIIVGKNELILIVDRIQDPGNLGTIIRTADAAGIIGVITTKGTTSFYNQKTLRATMGSIFRVPVYREESLDNLIEILQGKEINLVVGDINGNQYHFEVDYTQPTAIIVGNEGAGPNQSLIDLSDQTIKIPLLGGAESLNVAMATGVIVYEAIRQRMLDLD